MKTKADKHREAGTLPEFRARQAASRAATARHQEALAAPPPPPPARSAVDPLLYVASRASIPERSAMWRRLRAGGWRIVSSWIDEAGAGETNDFEELWARIEGEILESDGLVLYVEREDFPLKGALIEVGMALGMKKPVAVVLGGPPFLDPRSLRPIGSWLKHPGCGVFGNVGDAHRWVTHKVGTL